MTSLKIKYKFVLSKYANNETFKQKYFIEKPVFYGDFTQELFLELNVCLSLIFVVPNLLCFKSINETIKNRLNYYHTSSNLHKIKRIFLENLINLKNF